MSRGHGDKLPRKFEAAIAALLTTSTLEQAADNIQVNPSTLRKWLKITEFAKEYRSARSRLVESTIAKLQAGLTKAVEMLERNLTCGNASVEVRAALAFIDKSLTGVELYDLQTRLVDLEDCAKAKGLLQS